MEALLGCCGLLGVTALNGVGDAIARALDRVELGSPGRQLFAALYGIGAVVFCALALYILFLIFRRRR